LISPPGKGNGCNPGEARKVEDIRKASGALGTHMLKTEIRKFASKCLATKGICSRKKLYFCVVAVSATA